MPTQRATDRLIALARDGRNGDVRGTALFWIAQRAGDKAAGTITQALEDPETDVRKKAVFALSQLPRDEGVPKLIEVARSHRDAASPAAGDVLARTVARSARARVLRTGLRQ